MLCFIFESHFSGVRKAVYILGDNAQTPIKWKLIIETSASKQILITPIMFEEGDIGGYPIPQLANIPKYRVENGRNTATTFMIGDAYLTLYPSRVFFISSIYTPEINLSLREKTWEDLELIGTTIEKPGHWMSYQFHHRVTVRNWVFIYRLKSKVFQILTYIRQERPNEQYRNTVKDLLLPNTVS